MLKFSALSISLLLTIVGSIPFPVLPIDDASYVIWGEDLPAVSVCDRWRTITPKALQYACIVVVNRSPPATGLKKPAPLALAAGKYPVPSV